MGSYRAVTVAAADTPHIYLDGESADFTCNGTNDEEQIQSAIHACLITNGQTTTNLRRSVSEATPVTTTNTGGLVHLLPGSYMLGADIHFGFTRHQMALQGSGPNTIIRQAAGKHAITACYDRSAEGDSLQLRNFRIEGDPAGYHGIFATNLHRLRVTDVDVFGAGLDGLATVSGDLPIFEDDADTVSPFSWAASASGTNEYYLVYYQSLNSGKGIDWRAGKPGSVDLDDVSASEGTVGSLAAGEWGWGDNDTVGYNTVYVRLSDGSKPDPGDVEIKGYAPSSNNLVSDSNFQWCGRWGNRWIGNHETLVTNCHYEGNKYGGFWHEKTFNFKITNCSMEDTQSATDVAEYRSVHASDCHVSNCVFEGNVILTAGSASHESWANCAVASGGTVSITPPYAQSQSGNYHFANLKCDGTLSCTASRRLTLVGGSIKLGNIKAAVFQASSARLTFNGSQTLTVAEDIAGDSMDSMATFSNCYWFGDDYTIQASGDDNQSVTIVGGKFRSHDLTIDGNALNDVRAAITGASFRTSAITIDDVDFVAINGNILRGTGGDWTISNINNCITINGNTLEAVTMTASGTARLAATGNAGINTAVITSNVTGGENEAGNEGVTVSSIT